MSRNPCFRLKKRFFSYFFWFIILNCAKVRLFPFLNKHYLYISPLRLLPVTVNKHIFEIVTIDNVGAGIFCKI